MSILWPDVLPQSRSENSKRLVLPSTLRAKYTQTFNAQDHSKNKEVPNRTQIPGHGLLHELDTRKRYTHTCSCRDFDSDLQLYNPQGWRHQRFRPREPHLISRIALSREDPPPSKVSNPNQSRCPNNVVSLDVEPMIPCFRLHCGPTMNLGSD